MVGPQTPEEVVSMAVKLHRCGTMWLKVGVHPCWRVQSALDDQGIEYEVVTHPLLRGRRNDLERLTGQRVLPAIEFEDGSSYRAESKDMAQRVRSGALFQEETGTAG
jgi:Glutathione S-transferase, N-terminal domain